LLLTIAAQAGGLPPFNPAQSDQETFVLSEQSLLVHDQVTQTSASVPGGRPGDQGGRYRKDHG
jgi:hypothetical protein